MKELIFYKQPFRVNKYSSWVYDANSNFVFQFISEFDEKGEYVEGYKELEEKILNSLNSIDHNPVKDLVFSVDEDDQGYILKNGERFILIRGWGNLTGSGAHNFSGEKAAKIQDNFRDWIIYKLKQSI